LVPKGLTEVYVHLVRLGMIFMETQEMVVTVTQYSEQLPHQQAPEKM